MSDNYWVSRKIVSSGLSAGLLLTFALAPKAYAQDRTLVPGQTAAWQSKSPALGSDDAQLNPFNAPICRSKDRATGMLVADAAIPQTSQGNDSRKILFYRNPMGLPDTSPVPKKDHMGMDYIPVYDQDDSASGTVSLSPGRVQRAGVETSLVTRRSIVQSIHAPGVVQFDEHRVSVVAPRFDAFVDGVGNVTTGTRIQQGDVLLTLYGQEIVNQGTWLLVDVNAGTAGERRPDVLGATPRSQTLISASRRLRELGASDEYIEDIKRNRRVPPNLTIRSPISGFVLERNVSAGQALKAGDAAFRIADLSVVWINADVPESELANIQPGQDVTIETRAHPGRTFRGQVNLVYPQVSPSTRTARIRIALENPDYALLPGMFAEVHITADAGGEAVAVPSNAIIDSGDRQIALLEKSGGQYEPREVKLGRRGEGYVEVLRGLAEGDRVVINGNFLIDSESNLQSALQTLSPPSNTEARK